MRDKLVRSVDASITLANDVVRLEAALAAARRENATLREALAAIRDKPYADAVRWPGENAEVARAALAASPAAEEPQP